MTAPRSQRPSVWKPLLGQGSGLAVLGTLSLPGAWGTASGSAHSASALRGADKGSTAVGGIQPQPPSPGNPCPAVPEEGPLPTEFSWEPVRVGGRTEGVLLGPDPPVLNALPEASLPSLVQASLGPTPSALPWGHPEEDKPHHFTAPPCPPPRPLQVSRPLRGARV